MRHCDGQGKGRGNAIMSMRVLTKIENGIVCLCGELVYIALTLKLTVLVLSDLQGGTAQLFLTLQWPTGR